MTNDVVTTNSPLLSTDKQILLVLKKRYDLNPKQETMSFELGDLGVVLNNENDYFEITTALDGLKDNIGIDYTIEDTYTNRLGRIQHHTLYESRPCKIKIVNKKLFWKALKNIQEATTITTQEDGEIIDHKGIWYNLKSCELRYKNGKTATVSSGKQEIKFFLYLYQHKGEVSHFKDIARDIGTAGYKAMTSEPDESNTHDKLIDRDYTDEVAAVKKNFRDLMLSLNMPLKDFNAVVVRVPKLGYKLV